ncbi:hypothetical protein CLV52_1696 [Amnibacterium kyonggiense]|uniref:Uncharacterized protein n=2 Tax=Amnibacterium kyonggiense TaxID=595671 RepID=A0A4R7FTC4_9MICO|nr:hypothetical protein CLV52_1696 [Amnibacterium kyonggiense]
MPLPCRCCTTPDRARLDKMLRSGATVRATAAKFGMSESSVGRHRASHLQVPLLRDVQVNEDGSTVIDSLAALVYAIEGSTKVMSNSIARNQGGLALKAATTTRMLLRTLTTDLGITDVETARWLLSANNLARGVVRLARANPDAGRALADLLKDTDPEMAAQVIEVIDTTAAKETAA